MFIRRLGGSAAFLAALLLSIQLAIPGAALAQSICAPLAAWTLPAGIQLLEFPTAWQKACGTANVAVLDNGIFTQNGAPHPALNRVRGNFLRNCRSLAGNGACFEGIGEVAEEGATRGHGTHVAGIIGATYTTSNPATGLAAVGGCRGCSLQIVKTSTSEQSMVPALREARSFGAQVVNLSHGFPDANQPANCATATCTAYRARLDELVARDIVVVAASGNSDFPGGGTAINFPANHFPTVIAVGGADGAAFWPPRQVTRTDFTPPTTLQFGSAAGPAQWLIAPAVAVHSLFNNDHNWALFGPPAEYSCRDQHLVNPALPAGFGNCTGTSMSAPHVSAIAALMKSVDPLLSAAQTREFLRQSGSAFPGWNAQIGHGIPSAARAVNLALGGASVTNRLTPLFSLAAVNSPGTNFDHLYTVVPQVAMSAIEGTLPPQPQGGSASYLTYGTPVPGYATFPGCAACATQPPRAIASVFTTHTSPVGGQELTPLYRMSWQCQTSGCADVSHVYAVASELPAFQSVGYQVDGIDGFIYPKTQSPQPANTVKLCRKYDSGRDDYILFAGTGAGGNDCSGTSDGFSGSNYTAVAAGSDWLGYVHPVQAPGPVGGATVAFVNGGMESPQVSSWSGPPTGWIGSAAATVPNSYIGSPLAPQGTQAGFYWSYGFLEQAINLQAGWHTMSYKSAVWPGYPGTFTRVRVNGVELAPTYAWPGSYGPSSLNVNIPAAGSYTFRFAADNSPTTAVLIDDVHIRALSTTFANSGLESPVTSGFGPLPAEWYGFGSAGVATQAMWMGGALGPAPQGTQALYYHTSSLIGQTVLLTPGTTILTFRAGVWPGFPQAQLKVRVHGADQPAVNLSQPGWGSYTVVLNGSWNGPTPIEFLADPAVASWIVLDDVRLTR
jgi:hypothetical protein